MQSLKNKGNCVLQIGEVVKLNGGFFRVNSIGNKMVVLQGLPSTQIYKDQESHDSNEIKVQKAVIEKLVHERNNTVRLLIALLITLGGKVSIPVGAINEIKKGHRFDSTYDEATKEITIIVKDITQEIPPNLQLLPDPKL